MLVIVNSVVFKTLFVYVVFIGLALLPELSSLTVCVLFFVLLDMWFGFLFLYAIFWAWLAD